MGPDGSDIPRPACDAGLCCGAAQKSEGGTLTGEIIETCQLSEATTYTHTPPAAEGEAQAPNESWSFACIDSAYSLSSITATVLAISYFIQ